MVVVDASLAAALVLPDEADVPARIQERLFAGPVTVPQHRSLEMANVMVMANRRKRFGTGGPAEAIAQLAKLNAQHDPATADVAWTGVMRLAAAHKLTVYDAAYLELAIRRGAALASTDSDLVNAARVCGVEVLTYTP